MALQQWKHLAINDDGLACFGRVSYLFLYDGCMLVGLDVIESLAVNISPEC